jgi:hypothetical protein
MRTRCWILDTRYLILPAPRTIVCRGILDAECSLPDTRYPIPATRHSTLRTHTPHFAPILRTHPRYWHMFRMIFSSYQIKMNSDKLLQKAINIATEAHKDQLDKYGAPFIGHISRVMNMGRSTDERIVGLLHDLIEKTAWTFEDLVKEGFPNHIVDAIQCLTKKNEDEDYDEFTERVKTNPLAIKVKLNDLTDNMDIRRMPEVKEKDVARLNKYLKAYKALIELDT